MKGFTVRLAVLSVAAALLATSGFVWVWRVGARGAAPSPFALTIGSRQSLPEIDTERPVTVVVRGWLWDPSSRMSLAPLEHFPERVNEILDRRYGLGTQIVQYDWTRLPKDVFAAGDSFTAYAHAVSERVHAGGRCANFVGHSAGAALVYQAAARGVRMGYMGTLGLPTFGRGRPGTVTMWANFYTTTHPDDIAGKLWDANVAADVSIDLKEKHRDFWGADEVTEITADGIAYSWQTCP